MVVISIEMVGISIEDSKYISKFTVEGLVGSLLSLESIINMEEEFLEHAFKTLAFIGRGRSRRNKGRYQRCIRSHQV
jgi:hypothetical protein